MPALMNQSTSPTNDATAPPAGSRPPSTTPHPISIRFTGKSPGTRYQFHRQAPSDPPGDRLPGTLERDDLSL
jgi:hypothetical protein